MIDVAGYLGRLGFTQAPPVSAEGLARVLRAHVERVAYNNLDIQLGRAYAIDPAVAAAHIVATGRGGYCFHQNGALSALLMSLGYDVRRHRGGVWSNVECPPLEPFANHLVLTVHGLPTAENPGGGWFVDAGLGDALHDPLPLLAGVYRQGPFTFTLERSPALDGWRFRHDPSGSFLGMDFESALAVIGDFEHSHEVLSTSPESPFVAKCAVQRRDDGGADKLVSATLRRLDAAGDRERELANESEWRQALGDVFGITLSDVDSAAVRALWQKVVADQEAWKLQQAEKATVP